MGMSHKAPTASYRGRYWITDHACERFRTRMPTGEKGQHRDDADVCNLIDSLVRGAIEKTMSTNICDDGERALLVDIRRPENNNDLWAIVKSNANSRTKSKYPEAVVTLLYSSMVTKSHESGKWEIEAVEAVGLVQDVLPEERTKVTEKQASQQGLILIRYLNKGSSSPIFDEWADVESAEKCLNRLRRSTAVDTNSIRVFSEVTTEAKIVI